jgi:thymidine kinase
MPVARRSAADARHAPGTRPGRVEVVCGPMFAGKTEELLRRVRRAEVAGRRVLVVGHELDTRRGAGVVSSHSGLSVPSRTVAGADELEEVVGRDGPWDLVAVDEAHFFGPALVDVVQRLADAGAVVVVAGLDVTFDARPFEPLPSLAALAERVAKLTAVCSVCGEDAAFHVRTRPGAGSGGDALVAAASHVGGAEAYEARCRAHLDAAPWARDADGRPVQPGGSSTRGTNE